MDVGLYIIYSGDLTAYVNDTYSDYYPMGNTIDLVYATRPDRVTTIGAVFVFDKYLSTRRVLYFSSAGNVTINMYFTAGVSSYLNDFVYSLSVGKR